MKNEIEQLDLLYGVTIFNILNDFKEFKRIDHIKQIELAKFMNEWFVWLENQKNVNSVNIIEIINIILTDENILNDILRENVDSIHNHSLELIKALPFEKINAISIEDDKMFISNERINDFTKDSLSDIDKELYSKKLLFRDIIKLIIMNYDFKNKLKKLSSYSFSLEFLNNLNIILYNLYDSLQLNRSDLYYCAMYYIGLRQPTFRLFPTSIRNKYDLRHSLEESTYILMNCVANALHYVNKYYYIELPKFDYSNRRKRIVHNKAKEKENFVTYLLDKLNSEQKIFIIKMAGFENSYKLTKVEVKLLENIKIIFSQDSDIIISSQKTNDIDKSLIISNATGVSDYCKEKQLNIENYIFDMKDQEDVPFRMYLEFYILYNNFRYKFILKKYNNQISWQVYLKDKKTYKIKLLLEDDYKHIIESMLRD